MKIYNLLFLILFNLFFVKAQSNKTCFSIAEILKNPESVEILDLSNQKITEFPNEVFSCVNLKILNLNYNFLNSLPDNFAALTKLEELYVGGINPNYLGIEDVFYNQLSDLPPSILKLSKLKVLDIRANSFTNLPNLIFNIPTLEELYLDFLPIKTLSDSLLFLKNLRLLSASHTSISKLPKEFRPLKKLQTVIISNIDSSSVINWFSRCSELDSLKKLDIAFNQLNNFKEIWVILDKLITKTRHLENFNVSGNNLDYEPLINLLSTLYKLNTFTDCCNEELKTDRLPDNIYKLVFLKNLDLSYNKKLRFIAETFGFLSSLEHINFQSSSILVLPSSLIRLKRLKSLDLSYNSFTLFPNSLIYLDSLERLDLYGNALDSIPNVISKLARLKSLSLGWNNLKQIPYGIFDITTLEELKWMVSDIDSLPDQIAKLTKLRRLDLWNSKIGNGILPDAIIKLTNLEYLDVTGTGLVTLPQNLNNLKNLKTLNIGYNYFDDFVDESSKFSNCSKLEQLNIKGLEFNFYPSSLYNLKELKTIDVSYCNEFSPLDATFSIYPKLKRVTVKTSTLDPLLIQQLKNKNPGIYFRN